MEHDSETSNVILKLLNGHRIDDLANYLELLHTDQIANEDHTTLLVNCYAKMKDSKRLSHFVDNFNPTPILSTENVVRILRQSKFTQEALKLAEMFKLFEWIFRIHVEDNNNIDAALDYAILQTSCNDQVVFECLTKYGAKLIDKHPEKTCQLIKEVCKRRCQDSLSSKDAEKLLNIFIKNPNEMLNFLEFLIEVRPELGSVTAANTLLDLYLMKHNASKDSSEKSHIAENIMNILKKDDTEYDLNQAMISCKLNHFDKGLLYLYKRLKQYQLMLNYYVSKKDGKNVVELCQNFGDDQPNVWVEALCYFAHTDPSNSHLITILSVIEEKRLLSPILVIKILSKNPSTPISVLKDFFVRFLTKESEMIAENERLIHQLKDETEKMRQSIQKMQTEPKVFQAIKCSSCGQTLELPSVHFFCNHSFHHHCFQTLDLGNDCPLCLPDNEQILKLIKSRENNNDLQAQFQEQLARTDSDVIAIISNYLSKGLFGTSSQVWQ